MESAVMMSSEMPSAKYSCSGSLDSARAERRNVVDAALEMDSPNSRLGEALFEALLSWAALQAQFGADMKDPKKFRRDDLKAFRQALAVYPDAKVEQVDGGLLLKPSPPPIRRKVHAVTKG